MAGIRDTAGGGELSLPEREVDGELGEVHTLRGAVLPGGLTTTRGDWGHLLLRVIVYNNPR